MMITPATSVAIFTSIIKEMQCDVQLFETTLYAENENQGMLETGDLATKDNDGYIYIVGRKSRDVKLFGHRISLDEMEKILLQN